MTTEQLIAEWQKREHVNAHGESRTEWGRGWNVGRAEAFSICSHALASLREKAGWRDEVLAQVNTALTRAGSRHLVGTRNGRIEACTVEEAMTAFPAPQGEEPKL